MFDWIANRVFGPLFDALLSWAPWLWLVGCVLIGLYLFFAMPLVFKRWWQALITIAVAGFAALWVWSHFAGVADLVEKNEQLVQQNATLEERVNNLDTSIGNYEKAVGDIERSQRQIRAEIAQARRGLDSGTIREEVENDPGQAAADLSARWNQFGRMSDDATSGFGRPTAAAASPGTDADAGS
jgi:membrane protein implicated in regulation of membrane protease activity